MVSYNGTFSIFSYLLKTTKMYFKRNNDPKRLRRQLWFRKFCDHILIIKKHESDIEKRSRNEDNKEAILDPARRLIIHLCIQICKQSFINNEMVRDTFLLIGLLASTNTKSTFRGLCLTLISDLLKNAHDLFEDARFLYRYCNYVYDVDENYKEEGRCSKTCTVS